MEAQITLFIIIALISGQALCRPDWRQNFNRFLHFYALSPPVSHHGSLLTEEHQVSHLSPISSDVAQDDHYYLLKYADHLDHSLPKPYHGPLAVPVVLPSGHLADTPEVSAAKEHHLLAVAQARADKYYGGHGDSNYGGAYGYSGSYKGYAVPVVLPNGHIADTEEVAAAKSAHLLAVAKAKAEKYYTGQGEGYGAGYGSYGYSGSFLGYGIPVVLPNGHVADTHEVAAAKSAHLVAVAHAKAKQLQSHHEYLEDNHEYVLHEPHFHSSLRYISLGEGYDSRHTQHVYPVLAPLQEIRNVEHFL